MAPVLAVADPVSVTAEPTEPVELLAGAVRDTVGSAATAVTVTAFERAWLPLSSMARARIEYDFAANGDQVTE